jgi:hypothetical protein
VFENRVLRRIFGPKREEVAGDWRRRHNELHNFHATRNNIRRVKSRRMRWAGHVAWVGRIRNSYNILFGKLERRDHLEDLDIDGKTH